ncbi:MAG: DNA adenine methylase [Pseudomonadota bacterium]
MIKYIGSKRVLVPLIAEVVAGLRREGAVVDLFSGTARVGHGLKARGLRVVSNDLNAYAATLATCYVQADREEWASQAERHIQELNALPGEPGYFTRTFCERSRFFRPKNGARVDAIRDEIARRALPRELEAILVTSLMEAADRVDSTTGVQMAYLKTWAPRAHNDLELRLPRLLPRARSGKGAAHQLEAADAARSLTGDVGYLDPPYNQHKYLGNYHIWETLVRWDGPEAYGTACKRIDCRERKSAFNSKPRIHAALTDVVENLDVRHLVVSFNNEGYITREEMVDILSARGDVFVLERDFKRYVGAQIGIYNPDGDKVGEVSHLTNKEYLFIVPERGADISLPRDLLRSPQEVFAFEADDSSSQARQGDRVEGEKAHSTTARAVALTEAVQAALRCGPSLSSGEIQAHPRPPRL